MAARKKKDESADELKAKLAEVEAQAAKLQEQIEQQTAAASALRQRLVHVKDVNNMAQSPWSELMVGIRNVSDNSIGVKAQFKGDADLQLDAAIHEHSSGTTSVISYAWWRELRRSKYVERGLLVRDDTVLSAGYTAAPDDKPEDLPASHAANVVWDPKEWIDSRDEEQIRTDLEKMTSEDSLMRIRRAVDDKLWELESSQKRETVQDQVAAARWALARLSAKYHLVDRLITDRLETPSPEEEARLQKPIRIE